MHYLAKLGILFAIVVVIASCAPAPTPTSKPAATSAPAAAATKSSAPSGSQGAENPTGGTSSVATPAAKIKRGGTLVHITATQPSSMDPIFEITGVHLKEMGLYEALLRWEVTDIKEGKQEIKPELAESWERVGPTEIVLKLQKGVKFHDGSDFNAETAKWSLERMATHTKSLSKQLGTNFDKLEVVDPHTLRIKYKNPSALQLLNLTVATAGTGSIGPAMLSKAYFDQVGEEGMNTKPSTTAPFKLQEWQRDNQFIMTKFDGYWRNGADGQKLPYLDRVINKYNPDVATHLLELKAGTAHIIHPGAADVPVVKAMPDVDMIMMYWAPGRYYFGFNPQKEPFGKNLKLRQAAAYAIDRENIAKVVGLEAGTPSYWWGWNKAWPGFDESLPRYTFNLEKAKQLMNEAGYPNGLDLKMIHYNSGWARKQAEVTQAMWGKIGIRVTLEQAETVAARAKIKAGEFESHVWQMNPSPDPAHFNRMFLCEGSANWSNYCNRDTDQCMIEAEQEIDPAKRAELYKKCQRFMYEDGLLGGELMADTIIAHRKEVKGLKIQTYSEDMQEVWLDK